MKEKIAKWYRQGLWTAVKVKQAADKGVISQADYEEIVGA